MKNKYRVLSVILSVVLTVVAIIPGTFFASANNGYINEECSVKNTYDEEGIIYSSEKNEQDGNISYETVTDTSGIGDYKLSRHGKFEENVGIGNSNAIHFSQVRGSSETDNDVAYLRILNSIDNNKIWFIPDSKSKYTVKMSYKSNKNYNFVIREVGSFGVVNFDDNTIATFVDVDENGDWKIASAEFITTKNTSAIYIAVITENGEMDSEAEVYIDDVAVSLPEEIETFVEGETYSNTLNVDGLAADGWKASFSSNPQAGTAFVDKEITDLYESWGKGAANITRRQVNINWYNNWNNTNTFSNMGALTYTAKKYKYFTMTIEYKYDKNSYPWPLITFNQQNTTPEMFYKTSSYVTNPSYSEDPIGVHFEYEGHINISGKKTGTTRKTANPALVGTNWHKAEITVTPGNVYVTVFNPDGSKVVESNSELSQDYKGGYIALMQNGVNFFRNISITERFYDEDYSNDFKEVKKTYECDLKNGDVLSSDGWKASFAANPQAGSLFVDKQITDLYEWWSGGITRRQISINWYNNWNNEYTFSNMAALTYTAQKYKYFTMSVEYKYGKKNDSDTKFKSYPWPLISFNQQSTTPEMFYKTSAYVTDPTYSDEPIGVHFEYEGHINVSGKRTGSERKTANPEGDGKEWHKAEISVTPGRVYVAVYDSEGTLVNEHTTLLSDQYEGGYISLMQNGLSFFRNVSITEFEMVDMEQKEENEVEVIDLDKTKTDKTLIVSTKSKRWYDYKSLSAVGENGSLYKVSEFGTNLYKIECDEPIRLTANYQKRELDYDPEYTLKYYFDWEEELGDFEATRTPHPDETSLEKVEINDIWKISDNILSKPKIDYTGTTQTGSYFADTNILMLKDIKFRNFELTLQYKHGKSGGYAGGIIFGISDPEVFCNDKNGGIFAMVESDGRTTLYGKSLRNANMRIIPGEGTTNLPGYLKYDTKTVHFMKVKVLDGRVEMIIDGINIDDPAIGVLPKDYYGYIALAVANNKGWFDNLTIQPLDEWGNKITLEENEKQAEFNPDDIETDTWVDNSEWD